ncbi:MAG TPA: hypothetical protein VN455_11550 [Methanotrichaceae archaeon]|nr:hypothetical protein [Methanotrichaceae archaeon]
MSSAEDSSAHSDYSPGLERLLARASLINRFYEKDFDITFSSILLAFLANDDPVSRWFQGYIRKAGVDMQGMIEEHSLSQKMLDDISALNLSEDLLHARHRYTTSAKKYLHTAGQFCEDIAGGDKAYKLGVHHLMAVYIYQPWVHDKDLKRLGFERASWSSDFLEQMRQICPGELDFWREEHLKAFNAEPSVQVQ